MRVEKREFTREFAQLSCARQTRMRIDHPDVAGTRKNFNANKASKFFKAC